MVDTCPKNYLSNSNHGSNSNNCAHDGTCLVSVQTKQQTLKWQT